MPPSDKRRPFPDRAHEDLAVWVEETLAGLRQARTDVDDGLLLTDTLFTLVDGTLSSIDVGQAEDADHLLLVDTLFALVDELLTEHDAQRIRIDAVNVRCDTAIDGMDALQDEMASVVGRVQALEDYHVTMPGPDAAG